MELLKKFTTSLVRIRKHLYNDWLEVLGKDYFVLVIDKLDNQSIIACARVCKKWSALAVDDLIWGPRLRLHPYGTNWKVPANGSALVKYRAAHEAEQDRKREIEQEKKRRKMASQMDRMVCRMFHPSNGRHNFEPFTPTVPFDKMPDRETVIKILLRDNELRLSRDIQDAYWVSEYPSLVTLKVQSQAVKENGYEDPWIVPSAISYYKDDAEVMNIPHYVKYNRSKPGRIQVGDFVPDLPLTTMDGCKTSLLQEFAPSPLPMVLVAGSYT